MAKPKSWDVLREVNSKLRTERITTVARWALWDQTFGFYAQFPQVAEKLFESRAAAEAHRLSGSHYRYKPVKVVLRFERLLPKQKKGKSSRERD